VVRRRHFPSIFAASPKCRRVVGDFDRLPVRLQHRYFEAGIVQDFIVETVFGVPAARGRHAAA